jgi:hypothetical protein
MRKPCGEGEGDAQLVKGRWSTAVNAPTCEPYDAPHAAPGETARASSLHQAMCTSSHLLPENAERSDGTQLEGKPGKALPRLEWP